MIFYGVKKKKTFLEGGQKFEEGYLKHHIKPIWSYACMKERMSRFFGTFASFGEIV